MKGVILSTVLLVSALGLAAAGCPATWTQRDRSCYVVTDQSGSWTEGRDFCTAGGGYLAEINSADENCFLTSMLQKIGADGGWIGLTDCVKEGQFIWSSTLTAPSYTNFAPGEPNNGNRDPQNCVWLVNRPTWWAPGSWDDDTCTNRYRFICERSI